MCVLFLNCLYCHDISCCFVFPHAVNCNLVIVNCSLLIVIANLYSTTSEGHIGGILNMCLKHCNQIQSGKRT